MANTIAGAGFGLLLLLSWDCSTNGHASHNSMKCLVEETFFIDISVAMKSFDFIYACLVCFLLKVNEKRKTFKRSLIIHDYVCSFFSILFHSFFKANFPSTLERSADKERKPNKTSQLNCLAGHFLV